MLTLFPQTMKQIQMSRIDEINRHLSQLDELIRGGVLSEEAVHAARSRLDVERLGLGAKLDDEALASVLHPRPPWRLMLGISGFVLVFAGVIYAWLGNRTAISMEPPQPGPAANVANSANSANAHANNAEQMQAMIGRLVERLNAKPDDVEGWIMLGRSYIAMGKIQEAVVAQRKVVELNPKNAHAYADLADSLALANGRSLEGEPERHIIKALALDPDHVKALALSGTLALNRGQFAKAATQWEHALQGSEPDTPMANQLRRASTQARERAGLTTAKENESRSSRNPVSNVSSGKISGKVILSDALMKLVSPEDIVFIYARSLQEGAPPLAIARKQVKDLPFEFTLDDELAMSPTSRLSLAKEVKVGARISKSGNAKPQPGDLQGTAGTVVVGSTKVIVEINDIVR